MNADSGSLKRKVEDLEREEILNALRECNGIMARAARRLGITERMIGYKARKYGIRKGGGNIEPTQRSEREEEA
ncbi:MAG: hypothetical protein OHK006_13390 [Thermodesulfovibrionales bacterium]